MKVALFFLLTVAISVLVAADDTDHNGGGYIDYDDEYTESQSWIESLFSWLSSFFYTTEPGELLTGRPIQQPKYPTVPYNAYTSNNHLPNYPLHHVIPQNQQYNNYAYAKHIPIQPQYVHSNHIDSVPNILQSHGSNYQFAATPGANLQYPNFYKPQQQLLQHQQQHAQPTHKPHHQVVYTPTSHQSNLHQQHGPVHTSHSKPKKRRPWPLLTNAGKSPEQIDREAKELEQLIEHIRDREHSRLSSASLPR